MEDTKFIYMKENKTNGVLIGEDGGVACFHHNDVGILGIYYGRLNLDTLNKLGLQKALDEVYENEDRQEALFDFEEQDEINPSMLEEVADWMICPRQGNTLDNIIFMKGRIKVKVLKEILQK